MKKELVRERPFEYLRRQNTNEPFSEETVRNWYVARAYVLDKLKDVSFAPGSGKHLHAIVEGDSPLMLAIVRHLALTAHYLNFVEYDAFNRLVCKNSIPCSGKSSMPIPTSMSRWRLWKKGPRVRISCC